MSGGGQKLFTFAAVSPRLFVIVQADHPEIVGGPKCTKAVHAFFSEDDAWGFLCAGRPGDPEHDTATRSAWRVVEFVAIAPVSEHATSWGDGQFDQVALAPGLRAALRVTDSGEVVMLVPGGELTITAGACELGLGLLEVSRRAAKIRVRIAERAQRRVPPAPALSVEEIAGHIERGLRRGNAVEPGIDGESSRRLPWAP